ncbi:hypothetical protein FDECE_16633 [Fusarium decemcellulare]|nr:hypothetical protein FDECE_16633 [Fusarium decemcellulare]
MPSLRPWEEKALARGRRPLPSSPPRRNRDDDDDDGTEDAPAPTPAPATALTPASAASTSAVTPAVAIPPVAGGPPVVPPAGPGAVVPSTVAVQGGTAVATAGTNSQQAPVAASGYRYWSGQELNQLLALKQQGLGWHATASQLGRTPESVKQTFHKRLARLQARHATQGATQPIPQATAPPAQAPTAQTTAPAAPSGQSINSQGANYTGVGQGAGAPGSASASASAPAPADQGADGQAADDQVTGQQGVDAQADASQDGSGEEATQETGEPSHE